jgi:formimidoylglutamate deiminase
LGLSDNPATDAGWLPDLIYYRGAFQSGLALFAGAGGRITRLSNDAVDIAKARRLPGKAIVPGLINVHSHAFQRVIRGRTEHRTQAQRDTFWTWREAMYHAANRLSPEAMYHAARMAFLEMLASGITTVGEFHYVHHGPGGVAYQNRNLLALELLRAASDVGLRIALLRTAYARAGWQRPPDPGQIRFLTPRVEDFIADTDALLSEIARASQPDRVWVGVAPHSVRAVPIDYVREVGRYARTRNMPVHMHVAEQPAEVEACIGEYGLSPAALLTQHGVLDSNFTAIHAVHITPEEVGQIANARAIVGACPTTERNLGDGISQADRLFDAGIRVSFGSDSNVQIDLLEDARALEYHLRLDRLERVLLARDPSADALAKRLLECATEHGAASLHAPAGALEPGLQADFFTVDLNDPSIACADAKSLLNHIVFALERTAIRDVCVGGEFVIEDGRHRMGSEIVREFRTVQRELWGE